MLYFELESGSHVRQDLRLEVANVAAHLFPIIMEEHITPINTTQETTVFLQFYKGYVPKQGDSRGVKWLGSAQETAEGARVCLSLRHTSAYDFLLTLAHELIHVHQILRGDIPYMDEEHREQEADDFMEEVISIFSVKYPELYSYVQNQIAVCLL